MLARAIDSLPRQIGNPMIPLPGADSIFWGGYGGSLIIIDPQNRATYAFAMNKMGLTTIGDARGLSMASAIWTRIQANR